MSHEGTAEGLAGDVRGRPARAMPTPGPLIVAALASIGAGAIHATAVGVHGEERQAAVAFMFVAVLQIGWGALALVRVHPVVNLLGGAVNAAALGGWALAKASGIGFVDGLEEAEGVQFADGLAAAFAAIAVLAALAGLVGRLRWALGPQPALVAAALVAVVGLGAPAMVNAGGHSHAGGHGHGDAGHAGHEAAAMAPEPYDGTLPVDFSGTPGVSADEVAEAEQLATRTIERLPQFADTDTAYERGYRSIEDDGTGVEHYINWALINDDTFLDPDEPESLVYRVDGEERTLVAAMYMATEEHTLATVPEVGGDLIQWHVHEDLCFAGEENAWVVAGVTPPSQACAPGTFRGAQAPMIHVWITAHPCGAFAALEGVGGGQIAEGEQRACDHAHGDPTADVGES